MSLLCPIRDVGSLQAHPQQYVVGWHAWQAFEEEGEGRDFEIIALDNETARLEPRLHKVVIGKNTFSFLSTLTDTLVFPFQ